MNADRTHVKSVSWASTAYTSAAVGLMQTVTGTLAIPATFTGTTLTFAASTSLTGTFVPVYNSEGSAVSISVTTSKTFQLPAAVMACHTIKVISDGSEAAGTTATLTTKE